MSTKISGDPAFPERVRKVLEASQIPQTAIAERIEMGLGTFGKKLKGKPLFSYDEAKKVTGVLAELLQGGLAALNGHAERARPDDRVPVPPEEILMFVCPDCRGRVRRDAKLCQHCGRFLTWPEDPSNVRVQTQAGGKNR